MKAPTPIPVRAAPPKEMFVSDSMPVVRVGDHSAELATPIYRLHTPEEGGVLSYELGGKYPRKAFPFHEAVYAVDTIKRLVINAAKICR